MRIILIFPAWLFAGVVQASTLAGQLDAAWRMVPEARALDARVNELKARGLAVDSLLAAPPAVAVSYRGDNFTGNTGQRDYEAELGLPLWLPGQRAANRGALDAEGQALTAERAALRLKLAGELREKNAVLRRADLELALAETRLTEARALEADIARRLRAGDLARTDFLAARMETLAAQREAAARQAARDAARDALRVLSGTAQAADAEKPVAPEKLNTLESNTQESNTLGLNTLGLNPLESNTAESNTAELLLVVDPAHPELASRSAVLIAAREKRRAVEQNRRDAPELALFGRRERSSSGADYDNSLGVRLKFPFATDARNAPLLAQAQVEVDTAEAHWAQAQRQLLADIRLGAAALENARQMQEIAKLNLEAANENHRHLRRAFDYGERDLAALLRAKGQMDAARLNAALAQIETEIAMSRLNQARGVLP